MGLPDACLIEGQDGHVAEFICAVCCALVDAPLLTRCNHIFCMACLQKWIDEKPSCPTCSMELDPRHGAGELKLASPLAWRVLGRLRVSCPLDNCGWQGDYSELMSHMTSSTSHQAPSDDVAMPNAPPRGSTPSKARSPVSGAASATNQSEQHAEALNTAAKSKFEQRVYTDALTLYSKAIANAPSVPKYLLNRAATHFALSSYSDAIADCAAAVALDPTLVKAHRRMARAYVELGEYAKAAATLERASTVDAAAASELAPDLELASQLHAWQSEGEAAMGQHEYSVARAFFANILGKTSAPRSKLWMVRSELALGLCDRALRTCTELIKADGNAAEAYVLEDTPYLQMPSRRCPLLTVACAHCVCVCVLGASGTYCARPLSCMLPTSTRRVSTFVRRCVWTQTILKVGAHLSVYVSWSSTSRRARRHTIGATSKEPTSPSHRRLRRRSYRSMRRSQRPSMQSGQAHPYGCSSMITRCATRPSRCTPKTTARARGSPRRRPYRPLDSTSRPSESSSL